MTRQNFEAALREFQTSAKTNSKFTPAIINQGIALLALNRMDEAERTLRQAIAAAPDSVKAYYNLGLVYRAQGKGDEALEALNSAVRLDPNDAHIRYFTATVQSQKGNYAEAIPNFLKAIDLDPLLVSAYFGASRAYLATQQPERAKIYQDRFQELSSNSALNVTAGTQYGEQGPYGLAEEVDLLLASPATNIDVTFSDGTRAGGLHAADPLICLVDFDGDGFPDVFAGDSLYRNQGKGQTRFQKTATLQKAIACAAGDFDNDNAADLFLTTATEGILYRNIKGRFTPVSGTSFPSAVTATFVDLDHDGWLDLMVGAKAFRNKADGTFAAVAMPTTETPSTVVLTDLDNDRDVDLLLTSGSGPAVMLSNNRDGSFTRKDILPDTTRRSSVPLVFDFDKDGWMDLFLTRTGQPPTLIRNSPTQRFTTVDLPLPPTLVADLGAAALDFDNDGFIDIVFIAQEEGRFGLRLLRNLGSGRFADATAKTRLDRVTLRDPIRMLTLDADRDGDPDLLISQRTAPPVILRNDDGNRNHSLSLTLQGLKDNKTALGSKVEIRGEGIRQKLEVTSPGPLLLGTGRGTIDFVRILWPTGVVQDEIPGNRPRISYQELDRKGSSCPTLYTWDGSKYRFITDIIGPGVIGEWEAPGQWNASDTDEYVRLNSADLQPANGVYRLKLLSQMEEVTYLDSLKLVAIDTPAEIDVYPNDRYQPVPPYPEFRLWQVQGAHPPVSVVDDRGRDVSKEAAKIDGIFVPVPGIANYPGFADKHAVIIDVGPTPSGNAQLVLHGYTNYFDSTTVHSAFSSGIGTIIPYLEVADGKGGWLRKNESIGLPAGLPKSIVVDISGVFPTSDHRVRITNSMEIYWDQILVNTAEIKAPPRVTTLLPRATLGFGGYPLELARRPETYDYARKTQRDAFQIHRGNYTRYGDVSELMKSPDDMFAIMASGDEVTAEFDAAGLPPLAPGWHRTLLVYADGYEKAMETYTPFPDSVEPLPFHAMSKFPYPDSEHYPDDPSHIRYRLEYNTRRLGDSSPQQLRYRRH